jgi:hypothetical protein
MYIQTSKAALDFSNNPIFPKFRNIIRRKIELIRANNLIIRNILSCTISHEIFMNLNREKKSTPN